MKSRVRWLRSAVAAMVLAGPASAGVILNPGFETGDTSSWSQVVAAGSVVVSSGTGHSGGYSAKLSGSSGGTSAVFQGFEPTPTEMIGELSFWWKATGNPHVADPTVTFTYADDTTWVLGLAGTPSWTKVDATAGLALGKELVEVRVTSGGQGRHVYVDDFTMTTNTIPSPAALCVLGMGVALVRRRR